MFVMMGLLYGCNPAVGEKKEDDSGTRNLPNVVLILTDDLDTGSISRMPNLRSLLIEEGTTFENAFVTDPLCCPSRATILRGQYAHNHEILAERGRLPDGLYRQVPERLRVRRVRDGIRPAGMGRMARDSRQLPQQPGER
jgi:hypothetical protein